MIDNSKKSLTKQLGFENWLGSGVFILSIWPSDTVAATSVSWPDKDLGGSVSCLVIRADWFRHGWVINMGSTLALTLYRSWRK